jgi:3-deoxy-7-phosphoheptulonate synthase
MGDMIISLNNGADTARVRSALADLGLWTRLFEGHGGSVQLYVRAYSGAVDAAAVLAIPGVADVSEASSNHPLVDAMGPEVDVAGVCLGGTSRPVLFAGPCSVESEDQIHTVARRLSRMGVAFLRGGAFKPRTSPYDFQGLGREALRWMRAAADESGLRVVTEALSESSLDDVADVADLIQVGSRNMHNAPLLSAAGRTGRPVLVKRGMAATVEEWLSAGEYCLAHGAPSVVFCERGIRSFDDGTRNLLDLASVALLRHVHRVPVIVDPSHGLGRRDLILPLSRAAIAAGASGVIVEVHPQPGAALSDGPQAISFEAAQELASAIGSVRPEALAGQS